MGGINNYQYAPNPTGWVDPLGLCYETTSLKSDYYGEDNPNNPNRWNRMFGNDVVCKYLDESQRTPYEVTVNNGLLVHASGPLKGQLVDTSTMTSLHSRGKNTAIFVMDPEGKLYIGSHTPGEFHHSSFLSGAPVASAGEMTVKNGKILEISNESGHYQPKQSLNNQVISELKHKGMAEKDVNSIVRSGRNDAGEVMSPKPQSRFNEANNWQKGDSIPDDWMDF